MLEPSLGLGLGGQHQHEAPGLERGVRAAASPKFQGGSITLAHIIALRNYSINSSRVSTCTTFQALAVELIACFLTSLNLSTPL